MKTQVTIDSGGRVLFPKALRHRLGIHSGDVLELSEANEQITLKPLRQTLPLEKRHGFWIYAGPASSGAGASNELIANERETRTAALFARNPKQT